MTFRAGDWVEVRSKEEILKTLDANGRLEGLPFMPQMLQYCGQRFQVYKRAHKTCDTVTGKYVGRHLTHAVHLEHRCDGHAYGGCQAGCLIFWKDAWLKPVDGTRRSQALPAGDLVQTDTQHLEDCRTENDVWRATKHHQPGHEARYCCQATQLISFTAPLKWWDARQYVETYTSGNASLRQILRGLGYLAYYYGTLAYKDGWGRPARWLYDRFQVATGGIPFPRRKGWIPIGKPTPRCDLGLRPGELVRVRSYEEILATLDTAGSNRGLSFDAELVPYCGKVYRVKTCVEKFIDEKTGRLKRLKTPALILEGVNCRALYSGQRTFCPRGIHLWWREIWLERVSEVPHVEACASTLSDPKPDLGSPCLASPERRGY
jgi:hypothetical protein